MRPKVKGIEGWTGEEVSRERAANSQVLQASLGLPLPDDLGDGCIMSLPWDDDERSAF